MKWISVKDKLPEVNQKVLTITNWGMMCTMQYENTCDKTNDFVRIVTCRRCFGIGLGGITHWQPLPEPPK